MQNTPYRELEELREEVRKLREELALLRQFVRVTPENKDTGVAASAQLRCSTLVVVSREAHPRIQAVLGSSPEGGQFALKDSDGANRVHMETSGISVLAPTGGESVRIAAEPDTGRGSVLVSEEGNPRAVLKATSMGGCVSVLHDDGCPRGSLLSTAHDGADLLMITPDLKPGVRISSGAPNGGLVSVHRSNGTPAVSLMCAQSAAGLTIRKPDGKVRTIT